MTETGRDFDQHVARSGLPSAPRPRRSRAALVAVVGWYLLAGYFLFVAPWTDGIWNESFHSWNVHLHALLMTLPLRVAISAFGVALLVAAVAEVLVSGVGSERP